MRPDFFVVPKTGFGTEDQMAVTKVKTAIAWLERAGLVERNENNTRVFQGQPLGRNLEEAEARIAPLNLPERQKMRWLAIMKALFNARKDEGMSADELAELQEFREAKGESSAQWTIAGDTRAVLRVLHEMTEAGLIKQGILLNAFVRYKVGDHSQMRFEKVCTLERAMLKLMQESEPDAEGWLDLSLRRLNQRLVDEGHASLPEHLRNLLKSLSLDGKGLVTYPEDNGHSHLVNYREGGKHEEAAMLHTRVSSRGGQAGNRARAVPEGSCKAARGLW